MIVVVFVLGVAMAVTLWLWYLIRESNENKRREAMRAEALAIIERELKRERDNRLGGGIFGPGDGED